MKSNPEKQERPLEWYSVVITSVEATGMVRSMRMDVLGESIEDATTICAKALEPTDQIEVVTRMGTQKDYEVYDWALQVVREVAKRQEDVTGKYEMCIHKVGYGGADGGLYLPDDKIDLA